MSSSLWAQSPDTIDEAEEQIEALRIKIDAVQARIDSRESEHATLQDALREAEIQIGSLDRQLTDLSRERAGLQQQLARLDLQREQLHSAQRKLTNTIDASIQKLWLLQHGGDFRIWLGDQNPTEVTRNLAYFQTMIEAQLQIITEYEQGLSAVTQNRSTIDETQIALQAKATVIEAIRETLKEQRATRQKTLALIAQQVLDDQQRMVALVHDQGHLNALLGKLHKLAANSPLKITTSGERLPFAETQGMLTMPVAGTLTNQYGARRNEDIRWRGWLIEAEEGEPVHAVHSGDIIYADWLRGQGLLMVLDHGDGWLSLYGQNHSLLRGVGDRVSSRDIIARAGSSGGRQTSGVYFEIRHRGQPVDPDAWIRR